jgi:hypothetical protein
VGCLADSSNKHSGTPLCYICIHFVRLPCTSSLNFLHKSCYTTRFQTNHHHQHEPQNLLLRPPRSVHAWGYRASACPLPNSIMLPMSTNRHTGRGPHLAKFGLRWHYLALQLSIQQWESLRVLGKLLIQYRGLERHNWLDSQPTTGAFYEGSIGFANRKSSKFNLGCTTAD